MLARRKLDVLDDPATYDSALLERLELSIILDIKAHDMLSIFINHVDFPPSSLTAILLVHELNNLGRPDADCLYVSSGI